MPLALCTMSHSPLMGVNLPEPSIARTVDAAIGAARAFVGSYTPDLVVLFGTDHYNGFFYDLMPPFCIGTAATSVGDYGTGAGELLVDASAARTIIAAVLDAGVDVALSERLRVDHGFTQVLELLFDSLTAVPVVPVFVNAIAAPLGPLRRIRLLGQAIGASALTLDRRVLLVASGGLSHDPPVPRLAGAPPEVAEQLIAGRDASPDERAARERRTARLGCEFAAGASAIRPLNPDWDRQLLDMLATGALSEVDEWRNDRVITDAGRAGHEVRTWIAAYSALAAAGRYRVTSSFYQPIPEWIVGFGMTTAQSAEPREQP
jgi:2,3-dihydroxyphenylpropionate 1,2-dioxygenase